MDCACACSHWHRSPGSSNYNPGILRRACVPGTLPTRSPSDSKDRQLLRHLMECHGKDLRANVRIRKVASDARGRAGAGAPRELYSPLSIP